jgi:5-methylcytosine-specific restriction endonuclease McrA
MSLRSERNRRYYQKNKEKLKERSSQYREKTKDDQKEYNAARYRNNPEYFRLNYIKNRLNDPEGYKQRAKNWREQNPDRIRVYGKVQKSKRRSRMVGPSFTTKEWIQLKEQYGNICLCCKEIIPLTPDHVVPISQNGSNTIDNIQPLCIQCNRQNWFYFLKHGTQIDYRRTI